MDSSGSGTCAQAGHRVTMGNICNNDLGFQVTNFIGCLIGWAVQLYFRVV